MSTMLAGPRQVWPAPHRGHGRPTSVGMLALAASAAVHAALLLAPGASPRPEPVLLGTSVVQVRIIVAAPASSPEPASVARDAAASIKQTRAVAKAAEPLDTVVEQAILAQLAEGPVAEHDAAAGEPASESNHDLPSSLPPRGEKVATAPALMPVAFLNAPEPDYPASAREEGQEGLVVLRVRVSKEGHPVEILLGKSSGIRSLDAAALAGVKRWTFRPARIADQDIEAWMDVPIRFRLQ